MRELARRIEEARGGVRTDWTDDRARRVEGAMLRRRSRRAATRAALASATFAVVLVAAGVWWARGGSSAPAALATASLTGLRVPPVQLDDGSRAAPLDHATQLNAAEVSKARVVMTLLRGRASFDVTPNPARQFVVQAGSVDVQVLGTQFIVDRHDDKVSVAVQRGHVRVTWASGAADLLAGQADSFPPPVASPPHDEAPGEKPAASSSSAARQPPAPDEARSWRDFAAQGDFGRAYEQMKREGKSAARNDAADLLLAADVARMSGHSADAVEPLRSVLRAHRGDPRASLAAFTLGRVLLDELGRPGEAAAAFADARRLAPGGALAQDALAREVEALSKAGDTVTARDRANEYLRLYPDGSRAKSVRKFGGLE